MAAKNEVKGEGKGRLCIDIGARNRRAVRLVGVEKDIPINALIGRLVEDYLPLLNEELTLENESSTYPKG